MITKRPQAAVVVDLTEARNRVRSGYDPDAARADVIESERRVREAMRPRAPVVGYALALAASLVAAYALGRGWL